MKEVGRVREEGGRDGGRETLIMCYAESSSFLSASYKRSSKGRSGRGQPHLHVSQLTLAVPCRRPAVCPGHSPHRTPSSSGRGLSPNGARPCRTGLSEQSQG